MTIPAALADDEAVAIAVERPAGPLRLVVARREGAHRAEPTDAHRRDRRLGATGDHHLGVAALDDFVRIADGVRTRRAGGARRLVGATGAKADRDLARCQVDDRRRNEEGRDLARPTREVGLVLVLDGAEPADARRDVHADVDRVLDRHLEACVIDRELARGDRELDEGVNLLDLLLLDVIERVEALDLARDPRRERRRVKVGDRADARSGGADRRPVGTGAHSERRHQPDPRHHDSPGHSPSVPGLVAGVAVPTSSPCRAARCRRSPRARG